MNHLTMLLKLLECDEISPTDLETCLYLDLNGNWMQYKEQIEELYDKYFTLGVE